MLAVDQRAVTIEENKFHDADIRQGNRVMAPGPVVGGDGLEPPTLSV